MAGPVAERRSPTGARAPSTRRGSCVMANIASQEKRIHRAERERLENRRRTSQVKTWFRRLESAVDAGDAATADDEYREPDLADRPGREVGRAAPQQRRPQEGPRRAHPFAPFLTATSTQRPRPAGYAGARDGERPLAAGLPRAHRPRGGRWPAAAGAARLDDPRRGRARRTGRRNPLPAPRNIQIDHFVILMMENRSFDHYFGWLRDADGKQHQSYPDPETGQQVRDAPLLDARHRRRPVQGLRPSRPRPRLGVGPRPAARRLPRPPAPATTSSRSPTSTRASSASSTRRRASTPSTTATSARCSPRTWPNRYYKWSAQSGGLKNNSIAPGRQQLGDDLRPRDRARAERALLRLRPALRGAVRRPRRRLDQPDRALLRRLRRGHAAEHHDRRPALQRRRRRRRPVGRRAPARRRPARPGVHGRRRQRVRRTRRTTGAARCS